MIRNYLTCVLIGICSILIFFSFISETMSQRKKLILSSMSLIAIVLLIADKMTAVYNGSSVDFEFAIAKISKFLVYFLFLLIILVFNQYLKDLFLTELKIESVPKKLENVDKIILSGIVFLIISRITGFYYTYINNSYQRSSGYFISYIFPFLSLLLLLSVILDYRDKFRKRILFPLMMFTIAPMFTAVLQFYVHGLSYITSFSICFMVILLYYFSILDTNRLVHEAQEQRVKMLIEKQESIKTMVSQTTHALVEAIDAKDKYTNGHSKRVAEYASMIAERYGKSKQEIDDIYLIALLHDVGKIGIPDKIINKNGKLTDEEYETIKKHPKIGREILNKISISPELSVGASFHHERYDGHGYPFGLKGEEIPEIARIIAVADTYDAMVSKRSYRDALPQKEVRSEIEKGIGTQFDPKFAKIMLELIDEDTEYRMKQ